MPLARIGLGSNQGDAAANVERALDALGTLGVVTARSALYRTEPWGVADQPAFVNAAALLETALGPRALLEGLKALEKQLGRITTFRWGPRAIDLDILAYDDLRVDEPDLVVPHPRLAERAFALVPLAEVDPAFAGLRDALAPTERAGVQRIRVAAARTGPAMEWELTLERVRSAAAFCASAGLARFRIEEEDLSIDVRRVPRSAPAGAAAAAVHESNGKPSPSSSANGAAKEARPKAVVKAEFVGIVRLSRPSVAPGTVLADDRELAYVESLGIRNPVRSGGPGRVADVFVSDGEAVEYGQPLFSIEK